MEACPVGRCTTWVVRPDHDNSAAQAYGMADEAGKVDLNTADREMLMKLPGMTEAAADKISELLAEEQRTGAGLRVFVQGGGCSGFQYGLMIDEGDGDTSADQVFEVNGVRLLVDPISLRYLKGAEVDFVDNNMGGGFTIKNPNAKSTCGCGSSFTA